MALTGVWCNDGAVKISATIAQMKELVWFIIYFAIGVAVWAFYKITTRREREWMMWQAIAVFVILTGAVFLVTELLPALLTWLAPR